jgi:phosphopentomutase
VSRRAFVVVMDACGVGALPDAGEYAGDEGSNTLGHLAEDAGGLHLPAHEGLVMATYTSAQALLAGEATA